MLEAVNPYLSAGLIIRLVWGVAMSVILRLLFMIAGFIAALLVARDTLNFELVQTWVAILLVAILVGVVGLWARRRKT